MCVCARVCACVRAGCVRACVRVSNVHQNNQHNEIVATKWMISMTVMHICVPIVFAYLLLQNGCDIAPDATNVHDISLRPRPTNINDS